MSQRGKNLILGAVCVAIMSFMSPVSVTGDFVAVLINPIEKYLMLRQVEPNGSTLTGEKNE